MKRLGLAGICIIAMLIPYCGMWLMYRHYEACLADGRSGSFIIIDKQTMTLTLYDREGEPAETFPIACGKRPGNKRENGDMRTPEGVFRITSVEDSRAWKHDFGDGRGEIAGAYGPWFIRLVTPGHKGIGIHGTHDPASIGTRATEGCIRLGNDDLERLKPLVYSGMPVVILPSQADITANSLKK